MLFEPLCGTIPLLWQFRIDVLKPSETNRTLIIVVAVIAAVAIAGLFYGLMRLSGRSAGTETALQGAIREGSPQFEEQRKNIVLDRTGSDRSETRTRRIVMGLQTTVRNLTGKTLTGLEVRAAVVDYEGKPVKQRTVVVVPTRQPELAPNKTMQVHVSLDGMSETDARANIGWK